MIFRTNMKKQIWQTFVDDGSVPYCIIQLITEKYADGETLTIQEQAIFKDKLDLIEIELKNIKK